MMKWKLITALAAAGCALAMSISPARADNFEYNINFGIVVTPASGMGFTVPVSGSIMTDCPPVFYNQQTKYFYVSVTVVQKIALTAIVDLAHTWY